ncbi:vacuolar segregation protein PEP7-like isoform X2 [Pecten maximus]|uniref:vacuolar segregation protein PEP7-like isoform X2 n=1 Tax=Pecten maximus TaxID=6579 RepID=UPI00145824B1|nr:vacuolar segregation protein PEP7-like isoform X2 [Pecten maximus]
MMSTSPSGRSPWGFEGEGHSAWNKQVELAGLTADTAASSTDSENKKKEITRKHWKTPGSNCSNKECKVKLSLIQRAHHCRRCGGTFCENCLQYKRRLNPLANPDPDGKRYKVCQQCFEEGGDSEGVIINLTGQFLELRSQCQQVQSAAKRSIGDTSWRQRFDLEAECRRLISGFKAAVGNSELKRSLHEVKTIILVPDWQKSPYWKLEVTADTCQICKTKFTLIRKKHHCRLCSKSLCASCSSKDLLVFIPDEERSKDTDPKLAIIKINGCPTVEPEVSLCLRICKSCQDKMVDRQLNKVEKDLMEQSQDVFTDLVRLHTATQKIKESVSRQLTEYQTIVESLEDNTTHKDKDSKSNIKTLAKSQEDVADYLSQLVVKIQQLKKLKPESNAQAILFKNCLKSNCDFYMENHYQYRDQTRKLSESAPPDVLEIIQRTVDKNDSLPFTL